jgi:hypothetical protein
MPERGAGYRGHGCCTNNAVLFIGAQNRSAILELSSSVAAAQAGATRMTGPACRVTKAVANGSFILPSIATGEATNFMLMVNNSGVTLNVYPSPSEKMNGTANAALSVPSGQTGFFVPILNSTNNYPSTLDWRAVVIS